MTRAMWPCGHVAMSKFLISEIDKCVEFLADCKGTPLEFWKTNSSSRQKSLIISDLSVCPCSLAGKELCGRLQRQGGLAQPMTAMSEPLSVS